VNIIPNNNCILPNTISGLQVWLSSDSGVTENLDTVSLWTDRTGLGHDANQNISGHQPLLVNGIPLLNYKPVLRFDGDDTLLINTGSKVSTAFIVFNWGGLTDTFPNYNGLMTQQTYTTNSRVFIVQKDTTTLFIGNSMIFEDSNKIFVNGNNTYNLSPIKRYKIVSAVNDTGVNISNFVIGDERSTQGRLWNGDIVEIIIYDNPISYQHRIDVETYLHNKYAPPVNLGPDVAMTTLCSHTLHASPRFISYEWNGDSLINDSTYTVTSSGTYYVQVTDVFGFTSTDTVNVTYPLNQIDTTNLLCLGSTLVWDTQLSSSFTYDWHGAPSTGPVLNITAAGNYYVTVTDNNNCTLTSETVHVAVDSFPQTASLGSSPASLCSGNIIGLISGAGQAESYLWYDGSTNPTHLVTNTQSYSVIVTDTNDCVAYDTIYVTVTGVAPTAIFTASSTCEGDVMQFTDSSNGNGSGIISWHWDFGDTSITSDTDTVQNPVYVYADTLSHTVTLTVNTAIGCSNYITQNVQVHQKPQVNFSVANACGGSPVQFTDNSTAVNQSVTGWYWDFGDPTSGGLNTSTLRNPLHIFNTEGNYFVSLIATTNFGCSDTLFRQVVVHKTVVPSFTNLPTCFGSLMQFTGFSNAGFSDIVTWDWNFGDSSPHSSVYPFPSHFYVAVGSYYVTLTATTSFNCVSTAASSVNVNPRPVADFSTASPCINTPYTFQDSSSIPSGSIVRWDWNIIGHATFDSVYAPVYTFNAQGTDSITLKVYSNAGCISTITKTLTVRPTPLPDFVMDPSYGTPPLFVAFNNYTANPNSNTYHWDFGDGVTNDSIAPHHTFSNTAYYTVCLTATTSPYGCKDTMCHTIYVIKPQRDVAVLSISETAANNGLSISAQVANLGTLDIDSVRMKATLPDGTSIEEVYNGPAGEGLPYGTGIPETFNFRARLILPPASPHDFYCVEATILPDNLVDDVPSNNEKCEAITGDFSLLNPYPNPTEGNLNLDVILPFSDHLAIELFNAIGQKISVLFDGTGAAGLNSLNADLAPLAEGMYAIRFTFRDNTKVRQVMKIGRKK
jgi:PKD repeat protein